MRRRRRSRHNEVEDAGDDRTWQTGEGAAAAVAREIFIAVRVCTRQPMQSLACVAVSFCTGLCTLYKGNVHTQKRTPRHSLYWVHRIRDIYTLLSRLGRDGVIRLDRARIAQCRADEIDVRHVQQEIGRVRQQLVMIGDAQREEAKRRRPMERRVCSTVGHPARTVAKRECQWPTFALSAQCT